LVYDEWVLFCADFDVCWFA